MRRRVRSHRRVWTAIRIRCVFRPRFHSRKRVEAELANLPLASNFRLPRPASGDADRPRQVWTTLAPNPHVFVWVDSKTSGIVAADVRRLTLKKTNGTEPPYVGCYGILNQPWEPGQPERRSPDRQELAPPCAPGPKVEFGAPVVVCRSARCVVCAKARIAPNQNNV